MNLANIVVDGYERKARLYPALLTLLPAIVSFAVIISAKFSVVESLIAGAVGCGGAFFLAEVARDSGKKQELSLYELWGGMPSLTIFRHRDTHIDYVTKDRYHKKMARLVRERPAPAPKQEGADPAAADSVYVAWSNYIRSHTRDTKKYQLLFKELVSYGFRRNLFGMRQSGITISILSIVAAGVAMYVHHGTLCVVDKAILGAITFDTAILLTWMFIVNTDWVRVPAFAYAERLVECIEML